MKSFPEFSLNEGKINLDPPAKKVILKVMQKQPEAACVVYLNFQRDFPNMFADLQDEAKAQGTTLEAILDSHFQQDPTQLYLLDEHPALKKEVLERTGLEDFSRLGRLSKYKFI